MTTKNYHVRELEARIEAMDGVPIEADDRIENRLAFDWGLMPTQRWAQMDTHDGLYRGMWTNPFERRILAYNEGDMTDTVCDNDTEYVEELQRIVTGELAAGLWKWIDAPYAQLKKRLIDAGAGEMLSGSRAKASQVDTPDTVHA